MRRKLTSLAVATAALIAGAAYSSCTLITSFNECSTDGDCQNLYGPRAACDNAICVLPEQITGGTCTETLGTTNAPNGLLIGVLLPLTGPEAGFGLPLLNAVKLAWGNFDQIGGIGDRPIGLLICDTEGEDDAALAAGRHAIEVAKVNAIIGPDFSSQTIDIATQYAIPNGVLMVTPSGTASAITDLDETNPNDRDLIWRTAPSDTAQAEAIAQLVAHQITNVQQQGLDESSVWMLTRANDAYSDGLQQGLISGFPAELTNSPNLHPSVYPENWSDSWFTETALNLPAPDLVLIMGAAESWDIAEAIDDAFDSQPTFIFADAARNDEEAARTSELLRGRVLGTAPRAVGDASYTPYTTFRVKYQGEFDEDPDRFQFVANAYDALHVIALGVAGGKGVSGPQIAAGMKLLSDGESVSANAQGAQRGVLLLSRGESVNFEGASGRLDFDERGDPSPSSIALWCYDETGVPEVGDILSTAGEFTPLGCAGSGNNSVEDMGTDMGAGGSDMGADMGVDMGATDMGTAPDMSADMGPAVKDAG